MRNALVVAGLAACSGRGVSLQVHADHATTDHVELFVAPAKCSGPQGACAVGVSWATALRPPPGDIYLLDAERIDTTELAGGVATFSLQVAKDTDLARVVAVGFHGDVATAIGVLEDVTIHADSPDDWVVTLEAIDDIPADDAQPTPGARTDRAHVWRPPNPPASGGGSGLAVDQLAACLVVERWNGTTATREYFVPPDDRDCDGFTIEAKECRPYWFDFAASSGSGDNCLVTDGTLAGACVLGGAGCTDGVGNGTTCLHETPITCLPDMVCEACHGDFSMACLDALIFPAGLSNPLIPSFTCTWEYDPNALTPCPANDTGQVSIDALVTMLETCDSLQFRDTTTPMSNVSGELDANGAKFTVAQVSGCTFSIRWAEGQVQPMSLNGFLDFHVVPSDRHVLLPFVIGWNPNPTPCPTTSDVPVCQPLTPMSLGAEMACVQ